MNRKEFRQRLRKFLGEKGLRKKRSGGFGLQWGDKVKKKNEISNNVKKEINNLSKIMDVSDAKKELEKINEN